MDKVLITGGAGFIGSAIVPQLQRRGYDVYVIDDLSFGTRDFINVDEDKFFQVDIREYEKIQSLMDKIQPSVIVHLAAIHFIFNFNSIIFNNWFIMRWYVWLIKSILYCSSR